MKALLHHISTCITKQDFFGPQDRILVAISGGPDSVFLAHALHELGYSIGLAHVNYQTRDVHSDAEEELVRIIADTFSIPVYVHRCELKKQVLEEGGSFQIVARNIRYQFFEECLDQEHFTHCATAHHLNDRIESMLMSLIKGNSSRLFTNIPHKRERYVRPLYDIQKSDIIAALDDAGIRYSIDSSNLESHYLRNRIRNQVLPLLTELNPSIQNQLAERMSWYDLQYAFMSHVLEDAYQKGYLAKPDGHEVDWEAFSSDYGESFLSLFVAFIMDKWEVHGYARWSAVSLISSSPGKIAQTPIGNVIRTRKGIRLQWEGQDLAAPIHLEEIENKKELKWNGWKVRLEIISAKEVQKGNSATLFLDADKISWPISLRHWESGDKMVPLGMKGQKKLSDIFIDQKREIPEKDSALVITDQHQIIALSGFRIAEAVKLGHNSQRILMIRLEQESI